MGLRDLANKLAFAATTQIAGDIAVDMIFRQKTLSAYNPTTDQYSAVSLDTPFKGVETREKQDEDDNSRVIDDGLRILVASMSIPGITPKDSDEIVIGTDVYEIVQVKTDPATALWILSLRKP